MLSLFFLVAFSNYLYEFYWLDDLLWELKDYFFNILPELIWLIVFTYLPIVNRIFGSYLGLFMLTF